MSSSLPPAISPVAAHDQQTWSVMIPVHNCADLLARALPEVVAQLGGRDDVQIVVVDDASADDPRAVVRQFPCVAYHRNEQSLGAAGNFNRCVELSRGRFVHLLHGDDMVRPGFYSSLETALKNDPTLAGALCRTEYVDDHDRPQGATRSERTPSGQWHEAVDTLAISNRVRPVGIVVRRETYERVGGFRTDLPHAADWEMWMRVAVAGPIWFEDRVLAAYRVHSEQDTAQRVRSGVNVVERIEAIRIISEALPAERRRAQRRRAFAYSAAFASRTAVRQAMGRDFSATWAQLRQAARCLRLAAAPSAR